MYDSSITRVNFTSCIYESKELRGPTFSLEGLQYFFISGCSMFEINNFGQTLHEIHNIFQELLYINIMDM